MTRNPMKEFLRDIEKAIYSLADFDRVHIPGEYSEMISYEAEIQIGDRVMRVKVVEAELDDEFNGANEQIPPSAEIVPFKGPAS